MIFFETAAQTRIFLLLLYAGFGAAALYDAVRLARRHLPRWTWPPLDVLWCMLTAAACAAALAAGGESRARLYALLGLCCGGGIYCLGLRSLLLGLHRWIKKRRTQNAHAA